MTPNTKTEGGDLNQSLKKLNDIVLWFENQTEMDVEKGLQNVKVGVALIKACKERLAQIENEFIDVQREISDDIKKPEVTKNKNHSKQPRPVEDDGKEIDPTEIPY